MCCVGEILVKEIAIKAINELVQNKKVFKPLVYQNVPWYVPNWVVDYCFTNQIYSDKYNGNIINFIVDFSSDNCGTTMNMIWGNVVDSVRYIIYNYLPEYVKEDIKHNPKNITKTHLKRFVNR